MLSRKYIILTFLIWMFLFQTSLSKKEKFTYKPNRTVILIRHAEKPASGNDLSERGWLRAECISDLFSKNSTLTPKMIFAQRAATRKDENLPDSRRQIQTVGPLARALNLTIDNSFFASEVKALAKEISKLDKSYDPVLVSWNHEDMRKFLIYFGMSYRIAPKYPKNRYDLVWIINKDREFSYFSQNCTGLGDYRFTRYKDL
ncbi:hypothetical protein BCR32DRAFT_248438 [Anaeromyces robustus]|uniref:Phosphoglycerate mutase-like protein n=1 Tax=Anaeromyces robustus TaxID=1754192 RepID=A0A1Y1WU20_9FUNG|nr:hypothetical protein BCR32DRAFT_248438 [Anaeromyces robustus]|eukprot:ORX76808.1 hypothetical protein BCR32DRAFT_248438 [Anaeromyces robustus]